jgi:hypothetical protein
MLVVAGLLYFIGFSVLFSGILIAPAVIWSRKRGATWHVSEASVLVVPALVWCLLGLTQLRVKTLANVAELLSISLLLALGAWARAVLVPRVPAIAVN